MRGPFSYLCFPDSSVLGPKRPTDFFPADFLYFSFLVSLPIAVPILEIELKGKEGVSSPGFISGGVRVSCRLNACYLQGIDRVRSSAGTATLLSRELARTRQEGRAEAGQGPWAQGTK